MAKIEYEYDPQYSGRRIAEIRKARGYTQEKLVESSGMFAEPAYLSTIEHGKYNLTIDSLLTFAFWLNVSVDDLIYRSTDLEVNTSNKPEYKNNCYLPRYTGSRIQQIRKKKKLKQDAVYTALHISKTYFSQIENGHCAPALGKLVSIASILEVPLSELVYQYADSQFAANADIQPKNKV